MAEKQRKGILNYTTQIEPIKTAGEISGMLAGKGARSVNIDYQNGEPVALSFSIEAFGKPFAFRLPCNVDGVYRAMLNQRIASRLQTRDQAKRVAWRILKDWVEAQLALIEAQQAQVVEIFLPYVILDTGQTLFQGFEQTQGRLLSSGNQKQLGEGNVIEADFNSKTGS